MTTIAIDQTRDSARGRSWILVTHGPEVHALEEMLQPGEHAELILLGHILQSGQPAIRRWLVAVTRHRLLCIKGSGITTRRTIDIPLSAIEGVWVRSALIGSTVLVLTAQERIRIAVRGTAAAELKGALRSSAAPAVAAPSRTAPRIGQAARDAELTGDASRIEYLETAVDRLETDLGRLQQQVEFLESLLQQRREI